MKIGRGSCRSWGGRAAAALLICGAVVVSGARADTIVSDLGAAGPGNYAILGLNNSPVTAITLNGPGQTAGNVGGFGDVALNSSTPPAIIGNLYLGTNGSTAGSAGNLSAQLTGTISHDAASNTQLLNAASAATSAASTFTKMGLTTGVVDQTIGGITGSKTLTATHSGFYVVQVNGNITLGNTDVLTLTEQAGVTGAQFILDVNGCITLNGGNNFSGGDIVLGGGLTQNDAVINVTSSTTGDNVTSSGGSSKDPSNPANTLPNAYMQGILIDINGGIALAPGQVQGEIIGGGKEIRLVSGSQTDSQSVAPLPSTGLSGAALLGVLGAGLAFRRRRLIA